METGEGGVLGGLMVGVRRSGHSETGRCVALREVRTWQEWKIERKLDPLRYKDVVTRGIGRDEVR